MDHRLFGMHVLIFLICGISVHSLIRRTFIGKLAHSQCTKPGTKLKQSPIHVLAMLDRA